MNALPRENVIAAFPPSVKAGNVVLRPLTLGGAIRLAERGISTGSRVPKDKLFAAAFVLSGDKDLKRFLRRAKCGLKELASAVEEVLNQAFSTFIPPQQPKDAPVSFTPDGLGWPLELTGFLCAEYGWSFEYALETPVCRAFALQAVSRIQHGGKHGGPDYVERTLDIVKNSTH